jgi:hypothetical protein
MSRDWRVAEKRFGMLREPQQERKIINVVKAPRFVLSLVEGLREGFSATCRRGQTCFDKSHKSNSERREECFIMLKVCCDSNDETLLETTVLTQELATKLDRHSGQAVVIPAFMRRRDPESRIFETFWIPGFTGTTVKHE